MINELQSKTPYSDEHYTESGIERRNMLKRAYIEITNICNLSCSFCPKTARKKGYMSPEDFRIIARKLRPYTDYLYFHVMGEPLLHPELDSILSAAAEMGFHLNITTNGFLIDKKMQLLLNTAAIRKVSFSLHSYEGNTALIQNSTEKQYKITLQEYLEKIWSFCGQAGCIVALRLWNEGGAELLNSEIMDFLSEKTGLDVPSLPSDANGRRLGKKLYLESAEKFEWPINNTETTDVTFCHGLTQQVAVLCDGTVVPCCLDSEGSIPLGNLLHEDFEAILNSPRAQALIEGFINHCPNEELCRHCGYATRFR